MEDSKIKLVLASASPRRKELLSHLGIPFEILTFNVPEESQETDPMKFCLEIAELKGKAVFENLQKNRSQENFLVVSSDTIVCLGNKIYGKPADRAEARQFLMELAGVTHSVFTAVSVKLLYQGKVESFAFAEESRVSFEHIDERLMENYLNTGDSLDKAGAYGIQGPSLTFISKVEGSYSNVVGFPLSTFVLQTEKFLNQKFPGVISWFDLFH